MDEFFGFVQVMILAGVGGVDVGQVDGVAGPAKLRIFDVGAVFGRDAQRRLHREDGHLLNGPSSTSSGPRS